MGLVGCGGNDTSQNVSSASSGSPLTTESEQLEQRRAEIREYYYSSLPEWSLLLSQVTYTNDRELATSWAKYELEGVPVLLDMLFEMKAEEIEATDTTNYDFDRFAEVVRAESDCEFIGDVALTILRIERHDYYNKLSEGGTAPIFGTNDIAEYLNKWKTEVPEIIASDKSIEEKFVELRSYGILAIPYIIDEIEKGHTEYEAYFTAIGLQLTTPEYKACLHPVISIEDEWPTSAELYETVRTSGNAENFDWRVWYEENEEDLDNLFKFLDAYCAEYEAEIAEK